MNQILMIKNTNYKIIKILKYQLFFSLFLFILFSMIFLFYKYSQNQKEELSTKLIGNYNISKLYSETSSSQITYEKTGFNVLGIIQINKINLNYPIISEYSDELLKISPCKITNVSIGAFGNLCIAGHNYDNNKFFSKLHLLKVNDEITLYDLNFNSYIYVVNSIYEVDKNDISPLCIDYSKKELTLITCNNLNSNRLIVKCILK